jgi:Fe-S-cluster containining protein
MKPCDFKALAGEEQFQFACHPEVPCFNECCRDLNQALMPYDLLRLKSALNLTSSEFIARYAAVHTGPASGLPIVSLRFGDTAGRTCPFVSPTGCQVYAHRPSSCRTYPLARMLRRSREDGRITEHYALLQEPHCQGFRQKRYQSVEQWIAGQELAEYNRMNDALMELIALKNRLHPQPLTPTLQQNAQIALYYVEVLKEKATAGQLADRHDPQLLPMPDADDDPGWLLWGLQWIGSALTNSNAAHHHR